ncbi:hypothetical protein [Agromyces sp. Marseille-Q5079]|uniref:hypothetical protein n=1 Tax=Agromyces sp. Marseille-Q5079 TaxID=3439059 RepID=UPI003D9C9348
MSEVDYSFQGLPLHVLLVHVVLIAVPVVALLLVVLAAWPAARRVLWIPALAASILLVPLGLVTVEAGRWLEARVPAAPLIQAHTAKGEDIVPWLWAVASMGVLVAAWQVTCSILRRRSPDPDTVSPPRSLAIGVGVVLTLAAAAVAVGSIWTVVQIGESGSRAVWEGSFSDTPLER